MAHQFLDSSPQTERNDESRFNRTDFDPEISNLESFASPIKGYDDMMQAIRGKPGSLPSRILSTPRARQPLGDRKNPPGKNEFTPLLKSAAMNRFKMANGGAKDNGTRTPVALKPSSKLEDLTNLELSEVTSTSAGDDEQTPLPPIASSSVDLSSLMALPRRDEGGVVDGGNVLTLREQEHRLEQIDKENFGLKLKIHYLEENLKNSRPEANQIAIRENSDLKATKAILERDLKKNQKSLKAAELDLDKYRQQLLDYSDKIKRRHLSEAMQEEMEELRRAVEDKDTELKALQDRLDRFTRDEDEMERLRGALDEAEQEREEKEELLEKKERELQDLRQRANEYEITGELREKDRLIEEQADQLEELREELRQLEQQKSNELDSLEDRLEIMEVEHKAAVHEFQQSLDASEEARQDLEVQLHKSNSPSGDRAFQRLRHELSELNQEKRKEIEALEDRLRLAEASGDNKTQLAQQAAHDAREQLRIVTREKDAEIAHLQKRLDITVDVQNDLEESRRQLAESRDESRELLRKNEERENELQRFKKTLETLDSETQALGDTVKERDSVLREMESLRESLVEREEEIVSLRKTSHAQSVALEELKQAHSTISEQERQLEMLKTTLRERTSELEVLRGHADEPDSQLEGVQNIVRERDQELEALRKTVNDQKGEIRDLQETADERRERLEELKESMAKTKEELEDEIEILENEREEADQAKHSLQAKIEGLEQEIRNSINIQSKMEPLEKDLRRTQREKCNLEEERRRLEDDRFVADQERSFLQGKIKTLTKELDEARHSATLRSPTTNASLRDKLRTSQNTIDSLKLKLAGTQDELDNAESRLATRASPSVARELRQKIREMEFQHEQEIKDLQSLLKSTTLELEAVRTRSEKRGTGSPLAKHNADTAALLREKDRKLQRLQQAREKGKIEAAIHAQETETLQLELESMRAKEEEAVRLRDELVNGEKRHTAEIKGLARQIQWLRANVAREEGFRAALGYEKRWLQMQIDMYTACNKEHLRVIEEMGITPPEQAPERHSRLKVAGLAVIALLRMKKWKEEWAASRKLHESLVAKLNEMRRLGLRKNKFRIQ